MVRIRAPRLKNPPSPAAVPMLKVAAKQIEETTEVVVPDAGIDTDTALHAPVLKAKMKKVDGAFGKEKVKATPKEKVKLTHNEKMAARKELKKASKLKKKEDLKAAKKAAKKAKRTARRNSERRESVGRNFPAE